MKNTWVVVADEAIARILQWSPASEQLESIEDLALDGSQPEAADFARDIAARLAEARQLGLFHELRIAASPDFLPLLHRALSPEVTAVVTDEIERDMVYLDNLGITQRLITPQAPRAWRSCPTI